MIALEVHNAGAAPAVDVVILAWVLTPVGRDRTPEPAIYRGAKPNFPASQHPLRMQLERASGEIAEDFDRWREHYVRAGVTQGVLDPRLLLMLITYSAVDGSEMTDCVALPLSDQAPLPPGEMEK